MSDVSDGGNSMIVGAVKSAVSWVRAQSDLSHTCMSLAATGALAAAVPGLTPTSNTFVHLASLSTMVGTQCWVALVGGPTMFLNMERTKFGDVQARLFPKMGMVCMSMSGIAMATYLQKHSADLAFALLTSSLVINAVNSLVVFPVTTGYMYERRKHEDGTPERKQAEKMFHIHHGISNTINLGSIVANIAYLYILASNVVNIW